MEYKRKQNIKASFYNPINFNEAKLFMDKHNMKNIAYFSDDGLEDEDKDGLLELTFWYDGITLEVGQYLVVLEDGYITSMRENELNDFVETGGEK